MWHSSPAVEIEAIDVENNDSPPSSSGFGSISSQKSSESKARRTDFAPQL